MRFCRIESRQRRGDDRWRYAAAIFAPRCPTRRPSEGRSLEFEERRKLVRILWTSPALASSRSRSRLIREVSRAPGRTAGSDHDTAEPMRRRDGRARMAHMAALIDASACRAVQEFSLPRMPTLRGTTPRVKSMSWTELASPGVARSDVWAACRDFRSGGMVVAVPVRRRRATSNDRSTGPRARGDNRRNVGSGSAWRHGA